MTFDTRSSRELTKAKDSDSHTALHLACIAGSEEVVKALLEFNSDTTTMDDEFHTPLHLATGEYSVVDIGGGSGVGCGIAGILNTETSLQSHSLPPPIKYQRLNR